MLSLPPVGGLIPNRDEPSEGGVVRKLQELEGLMTGGAAVGVRREMSCYFANCKALSYLI